MNAFTITTPHIWPGRTQAGSDFSAGPDLSKFSGLDRLFDVLLDGLSLNPAQPPRRAGKGTLQPSLDVRREEKQYLVNLEIPGVDEENLRVEVRENELIISGEKVSEYGPEAEGEKNGLTCYSERSYGAFSRVLALPADVDEQAIAASCKNGILTLRLPRRAPEKPAARSISIARE
jgi:HSP20 family protein